MPLLPTTRPAALLLAALLLAGGPAPAQDKDPPDPAAVHAKIKSGTPGFAKVRERLAADPIGSRLRIDDFSLSDGKLAATGVMLVPGADGKDQTAAEDDVIRRLEAAVREAAGAEGFRANDDAFWTGVRRVRSPRLPHLLVQKAANKAGQTNPAADQLRLTGSGFDAKGRLVLVGQRGHDPATLKWLEENARRVLEAGDAEKADPKHKLVDARFAVGTDGVVPLSRSLNWEFLSVPAEWPLSPAAIQRALAGTTGTTRFRIDRCLLVGSDAPADATNPGGTAWAYDLGGVAIGDEPPGTEGERIREVVAGLAAPWGFLGAPGDDRAKKVEREAQQNETLKATLLSVGSRVADPGPGFQKGVAARPELDGLWAGGRPAFGPNRELVLKGVKPDLGGAEARVVEGIVRKSLGEQAAGPKGTPLLARIADAGVSTDGLQRVRIRELHDELKKWVRDRVDETRVARLYYDEAGRLTLTCDTPDPAAEVRVRAKLAAWAESHGVPVRFAPAATPNSSDAPPKDPKDEASGVPAASRTSARPPQDEPKKPADPKSADAGPVVTPANPIKASLADFLRRQVAEAGNEARWKALLVERGYFNERNEYTVRGVADSGAQKEAFAAYLASLKDDPRWAAYFAPNPPAAPDLAVIPMAKMEERARRVMPGYEEFDGIRVEKAWYKYIEDPKNPLGGRQQLVFDAHVVGRPDVAEGRAGKTAQLLTELIAADRDRYGRRLPRVREGDEPAAGKSDAKPTPTAGRAAPKKQEGDTPAPWVVSIRQAPPRQVPPDAAVAANDDLGDFAQGYAAMHLAKGNLDKAREWVERGILHAPHVSAAWYLSAYYHHLQGDAELVRRDLFRIVPLEDPLAFDGPVQRKRRYAAAKDLQGEKRDELEKAWLKSWKEFKDGAKPPTFAEPK